jgi:hypothetical protein
MSRCTGHAGWCSPLRIVGRVRDEPREHQPGDPIGELNLDAVLVRVDELCVDEQAQGAVHKLTAEVSPHLL